MLQESACTVIFLPLRRQCFPARRISWSLWPWLWMHAGGLKTATGMSGWKAIFNTVSGPGTNSMEVSFVGTCSPTMTSSPTFSSAAATWNRKKIACHANNSDLYRTKTQTRIEVMFGSDKVLNDHCPRPHDGPVLPVAWPPGHGGAEWRVQLASLVGVQPAKRWSSQLQGSETLCT